MDYVFIDDGNIAVFDIKARKYFDFALSLVEFNFDISKFDFIAEVRDRLDDEVAEFNTFTDDGKLILLLRREFLDKIPDGEYRYDVKRISRDETRWESPLMKGKFTVISGVTKSP